MDQLTISDFKPKPMGGWFINEGLTDAEKLKSLTQKARNLINEPTPYSERGHRDRFRDPLVPDYINTRSHNAFSPLTFANMLRRWVGRMLLSEGGFISHEVSQ